MSHETTRKARSNGQRAREKILLVALNLFAEKGYAGTSVRDVAGAAEVNLAAISYHFGDKAGMYRAALHEVLAENSTTAPAFDAPGLTLQDALQAYMQVCLRPLRMGKAAMQSVQLRMREYIEPTGLLESPMAERDKVYSTLLQILCRHFKLNKPDDELEALAFSIFALIGHLYSANDQIVAVRPLLHEAADAATAWERRFTAYALAMVAAETARRNA